MRLILSDDSRFIDTVIESSVVFQIATPAVSSQAFRTWVQGRITRACGPGQRPECTTTPTHNIMLTGMHDCVHRLKAQLEAIKEYINEIKGGHSIMTEIWK